MRSPDSGTSPLAKRDFDEPGRGKSWRSCQRRRGAGEIESQGRVILVNAAEEEERVAPLLEGEALLGFDSESRPSQAPSGSDVYIVTLLMFN